MCGNQLTVDVGQADLIVIKQGDSAHAAPGKGFRGKGANPADTEHGDG